MTERIQKPYGTIIVGSLAILSIVFSVILLSNINS